MNEILTKIHDNRRLIIRAILTLAYYAMIFYILRLLFFYKINSDYKDMINIVIGAILASFGKISDFWFKNHGEDSKEDAPN
jgi:hypothetical protein